MNKIYLVAVFTIVISEIIAQNISTYAGNGSAGYSGDNGQAISATFNNPSSVAIDKFDNLYIADAVNHVIRKINSVTGVITTVAGSNSIGFSGDNGLATQAKLSFPYGVAVDTIGNLFIADRDNNRIRMVNKVTGIITTIAGTGATGYSGDGGVATSAKLHFPSFITLDKVGNVYFSQSQNIVRKIDMTTNIISTVAGNGNYSGVNMIGAFSGDGGQATLAELDRPFDIVVDGQYNLFIADYGNNRIRKVNLPSGVITTIAGNGNSAFTGDGGLAINASLSMPWGLGIDQNEGLYITDVGNQRVRKIDKNTGTINTVAGTCTAVPSCYPNNNFSGDGGPAILAELDLPTDIGLNQLGEFFIVDTHNFRIRKVNQILTKLYSNSKDSNIKIFPNPCTTILNVELEHYGKNDICVKIFNSLNQLIKEDYRPSSKKISIDLDYLSCGVYYININGSSTRFVITR